MKLPSPSPSLRALCLPERVRETGTKTMTETMTETETETETGTETGTRIETSKIGRISQHNFI